MTLKNRADQFGHQLAMHLRAAHAHLRRRSNLVFSTFGLTADQYVLLTVLAECREATQQELVRRCHSDSATISAMLSLLQAKGFVSRKPHPEDGRAMKVGLTRRGIHLQEKMQQSSSSIRTDMVALFNEEELQTLIELLDRLAGAMPFPARKTAAFHSWRFEPFTPSVPRRRD